MTSTPTSLVDGLRDVARRRQVVLVQYNEPLRRSIARILLRYGLEVRETDDVVGALVALNKRPADALVLDIPMVRADWCFFAKHMDRAPGVLIVCSERGSADKHFWTYLAGSKIIRSLDKPVSAAGLAEVLVESLAALDSLVGAG